MFFRNMFSEDEQELLSDTALPNLSTTFANF